MLTARITAVRFSRYAVPQTNAYGFAHPMRQGMANFNLITNDVNYKNAGRSFSLNHKNEKTARNMSRHTPASKSLAQSDITQHGFFADQELRSSADRPMTIE